MSQRAADPPDCAANTRSSVLSSCGWMSNGWCVVTRILMLTFSGEEKMNSDAVDTWFSDLVVSKIVLWQLQNCHAGPGPIMLRIQSWIRYDEELLNMCRKWPKMTWRKRWGLMRFQAKKGEEWGNCPVTPCLSTFLDPTCVSLPRHDWQAGQVVRDPNPSTHTDTIMQFAVSFRCPSISTLLVQV
jgi:hypothetical protein